VTRSSTGQKSLSHVASRALGWSFLNNALARLGTLAIGIILARLLGPRAFGTFAVAYVGLIAVLSFNELGVSLAIVRWERDPSEIAPTVATMSILSSILIYIGSYLAAPAFAAAMGAPGATAVIRVLALNVIIDGVVSTPAALMQRYFRQDRKTIADQANNWVGAGVSVGLALAGFGAMSLAVGRISGAVVAAVLIGLFYPRGLRVGFDRTKARALLRFGLPLAGASIVVVAVGEVDQVVVGRMLGPTALGYYALALNLASWPVNMFSLPVRNVAPAVFSRLQHDRAAMRTGFLSSASLLGSVTLPVCFLISGAAVPIVLVVYGSQWTPAAEALVWLALLGAQRIFFEFVYDFFVVLARSKVVLTIQLVWLAALIPALILGAGKNGLSGVGMAGVAVATCVVLPWYLSELSKVGIKLRALVAQLWLPLIAASMVGGAAALAARLVPNALVACVTSGVVALAVIGLLVYRMRPTLAALRPALSRQDGLQPDSAGQADRRPGPVRPERTATRQVLSVSQAADPVQQASALRALLAIAMPAPAYNDLTGPLPLYRDSAVLDMHREVNHSARRGMPGPRHATREVSPQQQEYLDLEAGSGRPAANGRKGRHER
jgi:PST family polysaccharide transporter